MSAPWSATSRVGGDAWLRHHRKDCVVLGQKFLARTLERVGEPRHDGPAAGFGLRVERRVVDERRPEGEQVCPGAAERAVECQRDDPVVVHAHARVAAA